MNDRTQVFQGDCMTFMKDYPDKHFELAIVDPPYGIGVNSMNYTTSGAVRTRGNAAARRRDYRKKSDWDIAPDKEYFSELKRVSNHQVIWGGNYFSEHLPSSKSFIVWDKRCLDSMTNDFADCEYAWTCCGVARMFRYQWNGMIQGNMKEKEDRFHPTQKPVSLYRWLLKNYANEGDKILDTHMGSQSSRIAAYDMGFEYTGFELDKDYFDAGCKRFAQYASQFKLFTA